MSLIASCIQNLGDLAPKSLIASTIQNLWGLAPKSLKTPPVIVALLEYWKHYVKPGMCVCVCVCRDGLTRQSKSLQFSAAMLKSGLGLQRQYTFTESAASLGVATPILTNSIPDTADDLLDQILRLSLIHI